MPYNIDEVIAVGDPEHVEHHESLAIAVNDLDTRVTNVKTGTDVRWLYGNLVADNMTNNQPILQNYIDAGMGQIVFPRSTNTYLIDGPVYADDTRQPYKLDIDFGGNHIRGGVDSNFPQASTFVATDSGTRVMFFSNSLRSGLSGGVVNTGDSGRATGANGTTVRLRVHNGYVAWTSATPNMGLIHANRAATVVENLWQRGGKFILTHSSYTDGDVMRNIYMTSAGGVNQVSGAYAYYQSSNGDGVVLDSIKTSGNVGTAYLSNNSGAEINAVVASKIFLRNSSAININAIHQEAGIDDINAPSIRVANTHVNVYGGVFYQTDEANVDEGAITIEDSAVGSAPKRASNILLDGVSFVTSYSSNRADAAGGSHIRILSMSVDSVLTVRRGNSRIIAEGASSGERKDTSDPIIISDDSGITAAVAAGRAIIATGNWQLRRNNNGWLISYPESPGKRYSRKLVAPTITATAQSEIPTTTLAAGTYSYVVALLDGFGNPTEKSAEVTVTTTSGQSALLKVTAPIVGPSTLGIWRKTGAGASTTPDRYIEVGIASNELYLYDGGATVGLRAWRTSSIPTPPLLNTTIIGETIDGVSPYPVNSMSADRWKVVGHTFPPSLVNSTTSPTLGTLNLAKIVAESDSPAIARQVRFHKAAQGTGVTLFKTVVYDSTGALLGSSASEHAAVNAGGSLVHSIATGTFALEKGKEYYVGFLIVGGTVPTISRANNSGATQGGLTGADALFPTGGTGLTDVPSSITPSANVAGNAAYYLALL